MLATLTDGTVHLRRTARDDAAVVRRVAGDALPHLRPWMQWAVGDYDLAAAEDFLSRCEKSWQSGNAYNYLILVAGELAGVCGLHRDTAAGCPEIGYWLHPSYTGRGIATRAAGLLTDLALRQPGVDRVQIWHDAANTASGAVPRRLGYTEIDRRTPSRAPVTSGEIGTDVIWERRGPTR